MPTVTSEHKLPHTYKYRTHLRPLRRASLPSTYEDTYLTVMSTLPVLQISAHDTAHIPVLPQHGLLQHHMPINPLSAPRNRKGAPNLRVHPVGSVCLVCSNIAQLSLSLSVFMVWLRFITWSDLCCAVSSYTHSLSSGSSCCGRDGGDARNSMNG